MYSAKNFQAAIGRPKDTYLQRRRNATNGRNQQFNLN